MPKKTYYRNINDYKTKNGFIDAGSLWLLKGTLLVLVDDDNYVATTLDPNLFAVVD